jgi:hypothetical protein
MSTVKSPAKVGLLTSTSLVVGNMIASGVFLLPASLAAYGGIGLLGWIGSSAGAIVLALLFSRLSKMIPNALGLMPIHVLASEILQRTWLPGAMWFQYGVPTQPLLLLL